MHQTDRNKRLDPVKLLSQIEADEKRLSRGKLKIFFGSSAGVGKTYAMLQEAHRRFLQSVDVLVGIVETHDRADTSALLIGLPVLPRVAIDHRGVNIAEFDLDGALKRKPAIILIDELAHTNAPGSRHPKRWQDVEEVLSAGIDVYTTLNVQHLESLNDVVNSITGIAVRETVPDEFFDQADDIVLVDTSPDELLTRLRDGKVYIAPGANEHAVLNFFRKTNLQSLRELALRRAADYVDVETDEQRRREGLSTPNIAGDKLLICVGADMFASKLVRTGRRMATALKARWVVAYVEVPGVPARDIRMRQHIQQVLQSAATNGAEVVTLQGTRIGEELINYARDNGITKMIIGKSIRSFWRTLFRRQLAEYILVQSGEIDVYVVTTPPSLGVAFNKKRQIHKPQLRWQDYFYAISILAAVTIGSYYFEPLLKTIDIAMLYLMGVMITSTWLGRWPSLVYSVANIAVFDFYFVEPRFTLSVSDLSYSLTFFVMFVTSLIISSLAAQLREKALLSRSRERETQIFFNLTKELNATRTREEMSMTLVRRVSDTMPVKVGIWYPDEAGALSTIFGKTEGDQDKEETVVRWCFDHALPAGSGTDTMPSAAGYYLPIKGSNITLGVVGVYHRDGYLRPDQILMLQTFLDLLGAALEGAETAEAADKAILLAEKERLRNILLSSVSHDLRSPLAAITGAADALLQMKPEDFRSSNRLLASIRQEATRLTKVVTNLLDITRIEGGQLKLNMHPYLPAEIIGSAVESCHEMTKSHDVFLNVPEQLPFINMDGLLISQVIQNLVENACFHTPVGSIIEISADIFKGGLRIVVADNGQGIMPGQEKEIFKKFATFNHGDRPKGTGLGLSICQAIAMAHLGRIFAENHPKGGARFTVELPATLTMPERSDDAA